MVYNGYIKLWQLWNSPVISHFAICFFVAAVEISSACHREYMAQNGRHFQLWVLYDFPMNKPRAISAVMRKDKLRHIFEYHTIANCWDSQSVLITILDFLNLKHAFI